MQLHNEFEIEKFPMVKIRLVYTNEPALLNDTVTHLIFHKLAKILLICFLKIIGLLKPPMNSLTLIFYSEHIYRKRDQLSIVP